MAAASSEFIEVLGDQLAKATGGQISEQIGVIFKDAINNLPDSNLKVSLQKDFQNHLKGLLSHVKFVSEKHKSSKIEDLKFNLYRKDAFEDTLKSVSALKCSDSRERNCKHLCAAFSSTSKIETEKMLQCLKPLQDMESDGSQTADEKLESTFRIINVCKQIVVGYVNEKKELLNYIKFILGEISPRCEECLNSDEKNKLHRATILKDYLQEILLLLHFKQQSGAEGFYSSDDEESFEDVLAALISLYIDMVLISLGDQDTKKLAKKIGNFVFLLLGSSVGHSLDVLLQLSALSSDNVDVILPLIRCALTRTSQADLSCPMYIKRVCTARLGLKLINKDDQDKGIALKQLAEGFVPPPEFISWLKCRDEGLQKDLCLPLRKTGRKLTKHLLKVSDEDLVERLIDLASNISPDGEEVEDQETNDQVYPSEEVGFYLDSKGDTEMVDTGEEGICTNFGRMKEKFLQKQLSSLRSKSNRDSESDSEDENLPGIESDLKDSQVDDASDTFEESLKPPTQETDDAQTKSNKMVNLESQLEGFCKVVESTQEECLEPEVEETGAELKFDSDMENVGNVVNRNLEGSFNVQKSESAQTENGAAPKLNSEVKDLNRTVDSGAAEAGLCNVLKLDDSGTENSAKSPSEETHSTKTKTTKLKTRRKVCTGAGMITRARSSIKIIRNEDVLHLSDAEKSPSGRKRQKEVTDEESNCSQQSKVKLATKGTVKKSRPLIEPRRMSLRQRKPRS